MAEFVVTDPAGKEHVVTAPEGATQEQALDYAKQQFGQAPPSAPASPAPTSPPVRPATMDVAQNALYGGAAAIPDALLNAPNQIENLIRAAVGTGAHAVGAKDLASKIDSGIKEDPDLVRKMLEKTGLIKKGITPQGVQRVLDTLLRGGVGGALTGGASIPKAAMGAGMGALASGAGAAGGGLAKSLGAGEALQNAVGSTAGLLAPRGAAAAVGTLPRAATERGPHIPPERLDAYRDMTEKGARPSGSSLIYGDQNKNVKGQQRVANETWNEAVGLSKKSDFGLKERDLAKSNLSNDYQRLLTGREVTLDKPLFNKIKALYDEQGKLASAGAVYSEARPIIDTLSKTMGAAAAGTGKMDALLYNKLRSILGQDAQRAKADPERSGLFRKTQQALDEAADRSMPDIAKELGVTRGRYENLMILSDAMVGHGPGFITPAQIGKEVAQRSKQRSLEPNQTPLKELGRHGLSLSGDAAIDGGVNVSGMALHAVPKTGISLTAIERALSTPVTALRARGMGKEGFYESAKRREAELKEAARLSIIPLEAER